MMGCPKHVEQLIEEKEYKKWHLVGFSYPHYMNVFKRNDKRLQIVNQNNIYFLFEYKYRLASVTKWDLTAEYCDMFK